MGYISREGVVGRAMAGVVVGGMVGMCSGSVGRELPAWDLSERVQSEIRNVPEKKLSTRGGVSRRERRAGRTAERQ